MEGEFRVFLSRHLGLEPFKILFLEIVRILGNRDVDLSLDEEELSQMFFGFIISIAL